MFKVKTLEEAVDILCQNFDPLEVILEEVSILDANGRILGEDIYAKEYVPSFDRSTMDGYALISSDTFGSSSSMPAILNLTEEAVMGQSSNFSIAPMECSYIPTGAHIPENADSVQMIEYSEDYNDGTVGILKPVAPGNNIIFKGDDVYPGKLVLNNGVKLGVHDIGAIASLGFETVLVRKSPTIGIISTGDELVQINKIPNIGQIRDVNTSMLATAMTALGCSVHCYGIVLDKEELVKCAIEKAVLECDLVLISGGSSVGVLDTTCHVIEELGDLLFHGIALKPGKPTLCSKISETAVIGLPGNPVAAFYVVELVVRKLLEHLTNTKIHRNMIKAILDESIEANDGRTQCVGVRLRRDEEACCVFACPIRSKSGLITTLAGSDGYFIIDRDCEGFLKNSEIDVYLY